MQISRTISVEPGTGLIRLVHYAGLEDYPALFQPQNISFITVRFITEYFLSDYSIKKTVFVFQIDNSTKVNPFTGALDPQGIGEKDFFLLLLSNPSVIQDVIWGYIGELDERGDFNEENFYKRAVKPYPFIP